MFEACAFTCLDGRHGPSVHGGFLHFYVMGGFYTVMSWHLSIQIYNES